MSHPQRRQHGFSLIELMIAMLLGLLVIAGLVNVLMATRQSLHLQESSNFAQQNLRFISNRIGWSLRMGDFWAGVKGASVTGTPAVTGTGACNAAWILNANQSVFGHDGAATFPLSGCVDDANYVKGSDVLVMRYAEPESISPTTTRDANRIYVVTAAGQQAQLFKGSAAVPPATTGAALGRIIFPYAVDMYYLQPCSDRGADAVCGTADDGDAAARTPALVRMHLTSAGALRSDPLVDGVEQMQFEYGINTASSTGHFLPTAWKSASAMGSADWDNVLAVRMSVVSRSQTRDTLVPHAGSFVLSGDCSYTITASGTVTTAGCANMDTTGADSALGSQPALYSRQLLSETIQMRNRTRG